MTDTKPCKHCREYIHVEAAKCRHCKAWQSKTGILSISVEVVVFLFVAALVVVSTISMANQLARDMFNQFGDEAKWFVLLDYQRGDSIGVENIDIFNYWEASSKAKEFSRIEALERRSDLVACFSSLGVNCKSLKTDWESFGVGYKISINKPSWLNSAELDSMRNSIMSIPKVGGVLDKPRVWNVFYMTPEDTGMPAEG